MPTRTLLMLLVVVAALVAGCNRQPLPFDVSLQPTLPTRADLSSVTHIVDADTMVGALQAHGTVVKWGGTVAQPFFSVEGVLMRIDGEDVQVYEYASADAARADASRITPEGNGVYFDSAATFVEWIDTPHLYTSGRLIVVYVGHEPAVLDALEGMLGAPFAGGDSVRV